MCNEAVSSTPLPLPCVFGKTAITENHHDDGELLFYTYYFEHFYKIFYFFFLNEVQ